MSIIYSSGNIFDTEAKALVNPVNTVGVMGAGLALQFKQRYPEAFKAYCDACSDGTLSIGSIHTHKESSGLTLIHFPTKAHWREPSKLFYVEASLVALKEWIEATGCESVAMPKVGCGLGGLDWAEVKPLIESVLDGLACDIIVYV